MQSFSSCSGIDPGQLAETNPLAVIVNRNKLNSARFIISIPFYYFVTVMRSAAMRTIRKKLYALSPFSGGKE